MKTNAKNWTQVEKGWVLTNDDKVEEWFLLNNPHPTSSLKNVVKRAFKIGETLSVDDHMVIRDYPLSMGCKIVGSTFPLEGVPLIVLQDNLERMFKLGYRAAKNGAYTSNGTYQEDLEKALKSLDVLEFATVITGQCNCECHTPGNMVMHMQACCHPKETLDVVPHPTHSAGQLTTIVR